MAASNASTSILVLHDPTLDPLPFLQRLTSDLSLSIDGTLRWAIDNKYYTADVQFDVEPVEAKALASSSGGEGVKEGVPVVLYLFSHQPPEPLPPYLTRVITSEPRDVAIAIRIHPSPASTAADATAGTKNEEVSAEVAPSRREAEWDEIEEVFLELGMEVIDETVIDAPEDMLLDPLEEVRITVQTHMWPNMVRKPLATRSAVELDFGDDETDEYEAGEEEGSGESDYEAESPAAFPVGFGRVPDRDATGSSDIEGEMDDSALWSKEWEGISTPDRQAAQAQFPDLAMLNQQLAETARLFAQLKVERDEAERRRMERLDRLEKALEEDSDDGDGGEDGVEGEEGDGKEGGAGGMRFEEEDGEDGRGPAEGEWTRLEDWLEGDEDYEALDGGEEGEEGEGDGDWEEREHPPFITPDTAPTSDQSPLPSPPRPSRPPIAPEPEDQGFEDDFSTFHSAPTSGPSSNPNSKSQSAPKVPLNKNGIPSSLPLDPTPLLLHLQSVRAELAGVPDEDERRVRAAREVMAVLGLDMAEFGDLGDGEDGDGGLEGLGLREDEGWAAGPRT